MAPRSPADALVALRSLDRRWHALFTGLADDEAPDDLAHRPGPDGRSALDHALHSTRSLALLGRGLEQVLVDDDPTLHPAVADAGLRTWDEQVAGTVEDALAELAHQADRLATQADHLDAQQWSRAARVAAHDAEITALAILWDAVDTAVADLRTAEQTLRQVRGRP